MVTTPTVAIIGAGPAGLMAAERLSAHSHKVIVFEAKPSPARKFLMAGRGGLNLTHSEEFATFKTRYGRGQKYLEPLLESYPPEALVAWADELGVKTFVGTSGRIFPKSLKASPLLRAWLKRLQDQGVEFRFRHEWVGWDAPHKTKSDPNQPPDIVFRVEENDASDPHNDTAHADAVILACGGATWPKLGTTGAWVPHLQTRGVNIQPLQPHNCAIEIPWSEHLTAKFAGAPLKRIALTAGITTHRGEAVITQTGLEGGVAYILNDAIKRALESTQSTTIRLDLRPDLTVEELAQRLSSSRRGQSRSNTLRKGAKLSKQAIALVNEPSQHPMPSEPEALAHRIKNIPLKTTGLSQTDRAISTSGGVRFDDIDQNTMLKALPGVFVAGEMLDWDAPTGGYLLQATFATAVATANGVSQWFADKEKFPRDE